MSIIVSSGTTSPLLTSGTKDSNRWDTSLLSQCLDNQPRPLCRTALMAGCARNSSRKSTANVSLQVGVVQTFSQVFTERISVSGNAEEFCAHGTTAENCPIFDR